MKKRTEARPARKSGRKRAAQAPERGGAVRPVRARVTGRGAARLARESLERLDREGRALVRLHEGLRSSLAGEDRAVPRPSHLAEVDRSVAEVLAGAIDNLGEACARLDGELSEEQLERLARQARRRARQAPEGRCGDSANEKSRSRQAPGDDGKAPAKKKPRSRSSRRRRSR